MNTSVTSSVVKKPSISTVLEKTAIVNTQSIKPIEKVGNKGKYQVAELPLGLDFKKVLRKTTSNERLWHSVEVLAYKLTHIL